MSAVVIYSSSYCPYCVRAKQLLDSKGVSYQEFDVDAQPQLRREAMERSGQRTVPQIWIKEFHVGGFTDLWALENEGRLDGLLESASTTN